MSDVSTDYKYDVLQSILPVDVEKWELNKGFEHGPPWIASGSTAAGFEDIAAHVAAFKRPSRAELLDTSMPFELTTPAKPQVQARTRLIFLLSGALTASVGAAAEPLPGFRFAVGPRILLVDKDPGHTSLLGYEEEGIWIVNYERIRQRLDKLIARLTVEALSWGPEDVELVTTETARTARSLLKILPSDRELPRIAPDGEGGLYMAWEELGEQTVIVGISEDELYAVVGPGTPKSRHVQETKFDQNVIPPEILNVIPKRF